MGSKESYLESKISENDQETRVKIFSVRNIAIGLVGLVLATGVVLTYAYRDKIFRSKEIFAPDLKNSSSVQNIVPVKSVSKDSSPNKTADKLAASAAAEKEKKDKEAAAAAVAEKEKEEKEAVARKAAAVAAENENEKKGNESKNDINPLGSGSGDDGVADIEEESSGSSDSEGEEVTTNSSDKDEARKEAEEAEEAGVAAEEEAGVAAEEKARNKAQTTAAQPHAAQPQADAVQTIAAQIQADAVQTIASQIQIQAEKDQAENDGSGAAEKNGGDLSSGNSKNIEYNGKVAATNKKELNYYVNPLRSGSRCSTVSFSSAILADSSLAATPLSSEQSRMKLFQECFNEKVKLESKWPSTKKRSEIIN